MSVGTLFTLFVVPVFYSLIAAEHKPSTAQEESDFGARPLVQASSAMGIA